MSKLAKKESGVPDFFKVQNEAPAVYLDEVIVLKANAKDCRFYNEFGEEWEEIEIIPLVWRIHPGPPFKKSDKYKSEGKPKPHLEIVAIRAEQNFYELCSFIIHNSNVEHNLGSVTDFQRIQTQLQKKFGVHFGGILKVSFEKVKNHEFFQVNFSIKSAVSEEQKDLINNFLAAQPIKENGLPDLTDLLIFEEDAYEKNNG